MIKPVGVVAVQLIKIDFDFNFKLNFDIVDMADEQPAIPLVPVTLPPLNNIINRPPQPQNPPVAKDVAEGHRYEKEISIAHGMY